MSDLPVFGTIIVSILSIFLLLFVSKTFFLFWQLLVDFVSLILSFYYVLSCPSSLYPLVFCFSYLWSLVSFRDLSVFCSCYQVAKSAVFPQFILSFN